MDKTIYLKVYFRIEAGYIWGLGMSKERIEVFEKEIKEILTSLGFNSWNRSMSAASLRCMRNSEDLYCHPMSLSGYIKHESIPEVEKVLKGAKTFKYLKTDLFGEFKNYTPDELKKSLQENRKIIEEKILGYLTTKRSNLFKCFDYWNAPVTHTLPYFNKPELENIEQNFVMMVFKCLLNEGKIAEAKNRFGVKVYHTIKGNKKKK